MAGVQKGPLGVALAWFAGGCKERPFFKMKTIFEECALPSPKTLPVLLGPA